MDNDLDTLATALYVTTDDYLKQYPHLTPDRPKTGFVPSTSDAELITLAVMQALLGHTNERRWIRFANAHLRHLFPQLLKQSGYNKRLRKLAATIQAVLVGEHASPARQWQTVMADKGYFGRVFERDLHDTGIMLLRPARKGEAPRFGARFLKPLRQRTESVFDTLKGQLGLEQHGGRTPGGVVVRVLQRLLALTTAIWHNQATGQPVLPSGY